MHKKSLTLSVLFSALSTLSLSADVVTDWNTSHLKSIRTASTNPPKASRQMAILHLAIHDTIQSFNQVYRPYYVNQTAPAGASLEAAVAAAAKTIMDNFYVPTATDTAASLTPAGYTIATYEAMINAVTNVTARNAGIAWGTQIGQAYLALRANDGSAAAQFTIPDGTLPGEWRPTSTTPALLPGWGNVKPFSMISGDQFRLHPPPKVTSNAYTFEFETTKKYGVKTGSLRNDKQSEIAFFWADGGGTETPPGHWMRIAAETGTARSLNLNDSGRLLALVGMSVADAGIAAWDAKYVYDYWRPVTAIVNAATDGNDDTLADASWTPLIGTPPFPEYTSGHSTFSRSSATILENFFAAAPVTSFSVTTDFKFSGGNGSVFTPARADGTGLAPLTYTSFSAAADDAGISRIYGGIHFASGNIAGQAAGYSVAKQVFKYFLQPRTGANAEFATISSSNAGTVLQFSVSAPATYTVYASSDLVSWTPIANKASVGGLVDFVDTSAIGTQRFYRLKAAN
jgi:hypothetical protein